MARKKKQQTAGQVAPEETPADLFETAEGGFVVGVDGVGPEAPATEEVAAEEVVVVAEEVPVAVAPVAEETAPTDEKPKAPKAKSDKSDGSASSIAAAINEALQSSGSDLVAQASTVNASLSYVLVKSPASTYCFGRVPVELNGPQPSMELLCNIPVKAHSDIASAIETVGIPMSSRLFFHASGML